MPRKHEGPLRVMIGEIVSGRLGEGEPLPRETDIASDFAVSRGVARECIRGLEERGLVDVKHGRGATVAPHDRWKRFDRDVLVALLASDDAERILAEHLELQRVVETEAAALAAERASAEDVAELAASLDRLIETARRAAANPAAEHRYHEAEVAFHEAVVRTARNAAIAQVSEPIHAALMQTLARLGQPLDRSLDQQRRLLAAIASGDADEARAATDDHLRRLEHQLTGTAAPAAA